MNIRKISAKSVVVLILLTLALSLVACGSKYEAVKPSKDPKKVVVDKNYTKDLKKEKGVQACQIYVQNGMAIGTMVLNNKISDKDGKALAQKYANEIKKTYKDMTVNVQAIKNGKNVANILLKK